MTDKDTTPASSLTPAQIDVVLAAQERAQDRAQDRAQTNFDEGLKWFGPPVAFPEPRKLSPIEHMAMHVFWLTGSLRDPEVIAALGPVLSAEFRYAVAAFRARFGALMPDAQQDLFSVAAAPDKPAP